MDSNSDKGAGYIERYQSLSGANKDLLGETAKNEDKDGNARSAEEEENKFKDGDVHSAEEDIVKDEQGMSKDNTESRVAEEVKCAQPPLKVQSNSAFKRKVQDNLSGKGLENYGNTCYINSVLQILLNTPEFTSALANSRSSLAKSLDLLFRSKDPTSRTKCLEDFLRRVSAMDGRWWDGEQRDSKEFFLSLLTSIFNEGDEDATKVFYLIKTSIYRMQCSHKIENTQKFGFLNGAKNSIQDYITSILGRHIDPWKLEESFEFFCQDCNQNSFCTEERIVVLPKIIGIYFDNTVQQPLNLEKHKNIRTESHQLELRGVIQRLGHGANYGHYRAFYLVNSHWYLFDDKTVSIYNNRTIESAYMIFYRILDTN